MARGDGPKTKGPRLSKMPQLHDYQFYDVKRLTELYNKDHAYEIYKHQVPAWNTWLCVVQTAYGYADSP
eukprot:scaffold230446_cov41-Prasinocladus_malaysianus.AAC.1